MPIRGTFPTCASAARDPANNSRTTMDVSLVLVGLTVNPPPCAAQQRAEN